MVARLHLRILLDESRKKIATVMSCEGWLQLKAKYPHSADLIDAVADQTQLHRDTSKFVCKWSQTRDMGNQIAHTASWDDIRSAVSQQTNDRLFLDQLLEFMNPEAP